jgi:hypothetical protein
VKVTPKKKGFLFFGEGANRKPLDEKIFNNLHDFVSSQGMPIHCRDVLRASRVDPASCLCIEFLHIFLDLLFSLKMFINVSSFLYSRDHV